MINIVGIKILMGLILMTAMMSLYSPGVIAADLGWEQVAEAANYQFQLGEDVNFRKIKVDNQVEKNSISLPALAPGKYYWRVRVKKKGENSFGPFSETGSVNISAMAPISTALPSISFTENQTPEFRLQWKNQSLYNSNNFILETSGQADFSSFKTHKLSNSALNIPVLAGEKQLYWRVVNADKDYKAVGEVSSIFSQQLIYQTKAEKIKIIFPANNYIFYYSLRPEFEGQRINASWTPLKDARKYILQVGKDKNFTELYHEKTSSDVTFDYMPDMIKEPMSYYLRIRAELANQGFSEWSAVHFISHRPMKDGQIIPLRPAMEEVVNLAGAQDEVLFSWIGNDAKNGYCFYLCQDNKCQKKKVTPIKKTQHRLLLKSNTTYSWAVINSPQGKCSAATTPIDQEIITFQTARSNLQSSFGLDVFYSLSMGTFNDVFEYQGKQVQSASTQSSPLTLGGAMAWRPAGKKYSANGSFYISYLNGSQTSDGQKADIPPEVGINGYVNYPVNWQNIFAYGGVDLENFATYNVDEVYLGKPLKARGHYIFYGTAGVFKLFPWKGNNFFLKSSLSASALSFSGEKSAIGNNQAYGGLKYMLYLNWSNPQWLGKFSIHLLIKGHHLAGPTALDVTRIGLGIGYKLF